MPVLPPLPPLTGDPEVDVSVLGQIIQRVIDAFNNLTTQLDSHLIGLYNWINYHLLNIYNRLSTVETQVEYIPMLMTRVTRVEQRLDTLPDLMEQMQTDIYDINEEIQEMQYQMQEVYNQNQTINVNINNTITRIDNLRTDMLAGLASNLQAILARFNQTDEKLAALPVLIEQGNQRLITELNELERQIQNIPHVSTVELERQVADLKEQIQEIPTVSTEDLERQIAYLQDQINDMPKTITDELLEELPQSFMDMLPPIIGTFTDVDYEFDPTRKRRNLTMYFPFCIPFDMIRMIQELEATGAPPRYEAEILGYTWVLDFADYQYVANVVRAVLFFSFGMWLIFATGRLIKW
jgi:predicted  nucleic acid-binding Zn-ribbon protein